MKCSRYQHENASEARYCNACGVRLDLTCASCGHSNARRSLFCNQCGHALSASDATASAQHFASPEYYTPKHLAEKILTSKSALEGERKQVTVLFADLKGSMELLADSMQESVKRYSEGVRRTRGIEVQIRVGLNSGEVVVRSIGSDLHMGYTAVGQTTHLAARMEQLATPGSIRLTADTLRLVEGYVEIKPLGPVPVKGLSAPVTVYEATGAGAVRSRLQAAAARGFTRFVSRDTEMEQLRKALEQSRAGHGQLVATVGEPTLADAICDRLLHNTHRIVLQGPSRRKEATLDT